MPYLQLQTDMGYPDRTRGTKYSNRISKKTGEQIHLMLAPNLMIGDEINSTHYAITVDKLKKYFSLGDIADLNHHELGIYQKQLKKSFLLQRTSSFIPIDTIEDTELSVGQQLIIEYQKDTEEVIIYDEKGKYIATIYDKKHHFFQCLM